MTELLAALLGALVGGVLSAWAASLQTAKVLKHETDLAAEERREARRMDEERRKCSAADQLTAALADFTTLTGDERDRYACFVRMPATADVHRERGERVATLTRAGASYAHALPGDVRERWDALIWLVRFAHSEQPGRGDSLRKRDAQDLLNYTEYVCRSLCSLNGDGVMPARYPSPDPRRDASRPWGYQPEDGRNEPDLTDWQLGSRLVGGVTFTTGEKRWYGPNGSVEIVFEGESNAN